MATEGILRIEEGKIKSDIKEQGEIIPIRLNDNERKILQAAKRIMEQAKDSTAIKQLMLLGYKSITREETQDILRVVFENKRKNKRTGILEFEV